MRVEFSTLVSVRNATAGRKRVDPFSKAVLLNTEGSFPVCFFSFGVEATINQTTKEQTGRPHQSATNRPQGGRQQRKFRCVTAYLHLHIVAHINIHTNKKK